MFSDLPVWEKLAKEIIVRQIGPAEGISILDFGSGSGVTADYFAENNSVTAIEPSEKIIAQHKNKNAFRQIIGSTGELKKLAEESFDLILCHNVLEYAPDREEIVREFYRLLKPNGRLSVVKHNRTGRIMQMTVLLNNFDEANRLLDGENGTAQSFGAINYYDDGDITSWCELKPKKTRGLRTFWDLQQNQEIQADPEWQKKMVEIEMRVSENPDFQRISFFRHIIFEK